MWASGGKVSVPKIVPYKRWTWDEIKTLPPTEWLIDGFLPRAGSVLLYGSGNTGKTMITLDWALRLGIGVSWFGVPTQKARVLYAYAEGASDLPKRVQAWQEGNDLTLDPAMTQFIGIRETVNLIWSPGDPMPPNVVRLMQTVEEYEPEVIFLDPVQEIFAGMDNNSDASVQMVFAMRKELSLRGVATVFIHHMRKDADTYRGATTWRDLADVGLSLAASDVDSTMLSLKMDRNRFGPKLMEYMLTLQTVELSGSVPTLKGQTGVYLGSSRRTSITGAIGTLWTWIVEALKAGATLTYTRIEREGPAPSGGSVSRLLADLLDAGLLAKEKSGRSTYYNLTDRGEAASDDVVSFEAALGTAAVARRVAKLEPDAPEEVEDI